MPRFVKLLFVVLLLSISTSAVSAQQYERFRLPEGTRIEYRDETYQGFNLGEYRELLQMDVDLQYLSQLNEQHATQITQINAAVASLQAYVVLAEAAISTLEDERTRLTTAWEEENRLRHIAEQRPEWDWIPWTLSGVLAVVVVVLGIVVGVL